MNRRSSPTTAPRRARCAPSPGESYFRVGDYWVIPARTATGDVEWPGGSENPEFRPPVGVQYHYAPLTLVENLNDVPVDLRCAFKTPKCTTPPNPGA